VPKLVEIGLLAAAPSDALGVGGSGLALGVVLVVRTGIDNLEYACAKASCYVLAKARTPAGKIVTLVFDGVVEQGGGRFVLVAAVLHNQRGDGQQMGDIRRITVLAPLLAMQPGGEQDRRVEAFCGLHGRRARSACFAGRCRSPRECSFCRMLTSVPKRDTR
jgi:hypothetical protein